MSSSETTPSPRTLAVAGPIVDAMQRARLSKQEFARELGWTAPKVSRVLHAVRHITDTDAARAMGFLGVRDPECAEVLAIARDLLRTEWSERHGQYPAPMMPSVRRITASAVRVTCYASTTLPAALQTGAYTWALLGQWWPADEVDNRVAMRGRSNLDLVGPDNPDLTYFLAERAITQSGMTDSVMSEQVNHLSRVESRPHVTIRVLPDSVGARPYPSFSLLEFDRHRTLVLLDDFVTSTYLEHPDTVYAYYKVVADLALSALLVPNSRHLLSSYASQFAKAAADATGADGVEQSEVSP